MAPAPSLAAPVLDRPAVVRVHACRVSDETGCRPLTDRERAVLDLMLHDGVPDVASLREQARQVQVTDSCRCGCPSIYLGQGEDGGWREVSSAGVRDTDDGIYLSVNRRGLYTLDYMWVGDSAPKEFPDVEQLEVNKDG